MSSFSRFLLPAAGMVLAACIGPAAAQQSTVLPDALAPEGQEACYGRVYDDAHMKAHPQQKVRRIFFLSGHDPVSRPNEEASSELGSDGGYNGFLATTMRGAERPQWVGGWCGGGGDDGGAPGQFGCGMECDRTMALMRFDGKGSLVLYDLPQDLYLDPGAEEEMTEAEYADAQFGADDVNFRLDPQPLDKCKAEFARIDPPNPALGEPLRKRLAPDQPFCYGRDYAAAHLASHPDQATVMVRVFRGPTEIAAYAASGSRDYWPDDADVTVSITARQPGTPVAQTYSCLGEADQWRCAVSGGVADTCEAAADREIFLRRGVDGAMMMGNPNNALPIVDMCAAGDETKSDDKVFKLKPMPLSACGL